MVEDCADSFKEPAIEGFGDTIVLWGVMGGKAAFGTFLLKEFRECVAGELTTTV